jgi:hypothetical protein
MSRHLSFNAFYVFSKAFDSVQLDNNTAQGGVQNFANMGEDRGRADIDMRHQAVVSMIWQPDYYTGGSGILRNILNGWSISPILNVHTGLPFTVLNGADANFDGNNTDRAQIVADPGSGTCPNGAVVGAATCWFNTTAVVRNAPANGKPVDGNSPRNFLEGPGFKELDLAIFRNFKLRERLTLQLRGEAMNVCNFANLNNPNATAPAAIPTAAQQNTLGTFGTISSAAPTRALQLGMRLTF